MTEETLTPSGRNV